MSENKFEFTFNSFNYMKELSLSDLEEVERKPFMLVGIVLTLLMGAMNTDPEKKVSAKQVEGYLAEYIKTKPIGTLLNDLMIALQESDFFKSLQMSQIQE